MTTDTSKSPPAHQSASRAMASDRIKLLAYRILDPAKSDAGTPARADRSTSGEAVATTSSAPFYTDTDPGDPVYHDNADCPYGIEIKNHHNDHPGTDHRRHCDWCAHHVQSVAVQR